MTRPDNVDCQCGLLLSKQIQILSQIPVKFTVKRPLDLLLRGLTWTTNFERRANFEFTS